MPMLFASWVPLSHNLHFLTDLVEYLFRIFRSEEGLSLKNVMCCSGNVKSTPIFIHVCNTNKCIYKKCI